MAATSPTSRSGKTVSAAEAKDIVAEAKKGGVSSGEKKAVQDLFDTGALSAAAKVELGAMLGDGSLQQLIPADWRKALSAELQTPAFSRLETFLGQEAVSGRKIFPPRDEIFAALSQTPLNKVRVVVIGQDPYPTAGNANGLAFSVNPDKKIPGSLKNIYDVLGKDVGVTLPPNGDLTQWADQGVLLLNTVLTVREGEPNSHHGKGWEELTGAILKKINESDQPVVFLLLGAQAQKMASMIDTSKHAIVVAPHPSPMNTANFLKSRPFSAVNAALEARGRGSIDWQIR